jgi:protocatechuate 3,4-dioxygenase beta subunit
MRDISLSTITQAAHDSFAGLPDARRRELMQQLVQHLHAFAKTTQLTHDEWRAAMAFLHRSGDISSSTRSEFGLLSDVLGLSSLVDLLASPEGVPGATPGSVLGPFHTAGSPWKENPVDLTPGNPGEQVLFRGCVRGPAGQPLPQATLDYWQNAANGLYWQLDPSQPTDNLRCQLRVAADGGFAVRTIRPQPYQIPTDGPVWHDVVGPAGRTAWRPAHVHVIVSAPGFRTLVTELFDAEDPWLDRDAVFGVRAPLVLQARRVPGSDVPVMETDFVLAPAET